MYSYENNGLVELIWTTWWHHITPARFEILCLHDTIFKKGLYLWRMLCSDNVSKNVYLLCMMKQSFTSPLNGPKFLRNPRQALSTDFNFQIQLNLSINNSLICKSHLISIVMKHRRCISSNWSSMKSQLTCLPSDWPIKTKFEFLLYFQCPSYISLNSKI